MTSTPSGNIFLCGGMEESGEKLSTCEHFDGKTWTFIQDLPTPLTSFCMVAAKNELFAIGGYDNPVNNTEVRIIIID